MKKIITVLAFLFLRLLVFSQILPNPNVLVGPVNITSGTDFEGFNSIVAGSNIYNVSGAGNSILEGVDYVQALPGYEASAFTTGSAWLRINTNLPRVASFHPNGFSNILKFERFEIGITIPDVIQNQINSYILAGSNGANRINPYDPTQIKVECTFTSLSGPVQQFKRHGFYKSSDIIANYGVTNDWTVLPGVPSYPFRIRFAPPIVGSWRGVVNVYLNNQPTASYTSYLFFFTVSPSSNLGHLGVSTNQNIQKFKYADGTIFYGVGRNVAFAENDVHPILTCEDNYRAAWRARPIAHKEHRNAIVDIASNQCNFVRIRLDKGSVPIEETYICKIVSNNNLPSVNDLTNFSANEKFMWEMDNTLGLCESYNTKVMLTLLDNEDLTWDSTTIANGQGWPRNPYSVLSGVNTRNDFFSDAVLNIFKKRLYYIEARWGYSTSIAAWELFNETEGMGGNTPKKDFALGTSDTVNKWMCKVRDTLQINIYPPHPVTTGGCHAPGEGVSVNWDQIAPKKYCLDFYTDHAYQPELIADIVPPHLNTYYNSITKAGQDYSAYYFDYWNSGIFPPGPNKKPHLFGEYGLGVTDKIGPRAHFIHRHSASTFHSQNWGSLFTNSMTTALQWWVWHINGDDSIPRSINMADPKANPFHIQYNALSKFASRINFNTLLLPDRNKDTLKWRGNTHIYAINEDDKTDDVLTYWMRTAGKDTVYGWTKNNTANFMSDRYGSNIPIDSPFYYTGVPNRITAMIAANNTLTKVQGLLPSTTYQIKVYDTWDPSGNQIGNTLTRTTDASGKLSFGFAMNYLPPLTTPDSIYTDYAFIAIKVHGGRRSDNDSTNTGYTPIDTISNNPANTIIVFNDTGTIMGSNNTASNGSTTLNTKTSTSDTDIATNQNDRVYPVPASNQLYLVLGKNWQSPEVFIIDELSRESKKTLNNDRSIDVKDLPNGFYTLRVKDAKHEKMFKIVIEH